MLNVTDIGEGTPILWIHGFPLASSIFERQLSILGVRHVMPDLPGFGLSSAPAGAMTMEDYAQLSLKVLDDRKIDRAVFAGLSMGGYICFAAARIAPERMSGLILIDTRETPDSDDARKGRFESAEKVQADGVAPLADTLLPKMLTESAPQAFRDRVREIMKSSKPAGVITALRAMAERPDSSDVLPTIQVPTLIAVGEEDTVTPPSDAERMAQAIPEARLVRLRGAAHLSNIERAEEFNDACREFLRTTG